MAAPPRRRPTAEVDEIMLTEALTKYVEEVGCKKSFVLGHYEFLRKDCAVHASSLARMPSL
eukprot:2469061-Pyramimonas_sp.AAC.1